MYKGKEVVGKKIITSDTGEVIEKVRDVLFDARSREVLGFLVDEGGVFAASRVLPFSNIKTIGQDGIIIESASLIVHASDIEKAKELLAENNVAVGTKVMTEDGRELGAISDIYFNEMDGMIEGYEVTGGMFSDMMTGKSYVPNPESIRIGEDVAFVPNETAFLMEEQVGGIQGALEDASDAVKEKAGELKEKAVDVYDSASNKASEVSESIQVTTIEQTKGRRAKDFVRTSTGSIIVAPGQIVTQKQIDRASTEGKEVELVKSVAMASALSIKDKASEGIDGAGSALERGAEKIKDAVSGIWDSAKEKGGELKEKAADQLEEERVKHALGRPVSKVIFDREDNVILNTGDLITNESIESARKAEMLDVLLASASSDNPEFGLEERKASDSQK